MALACAMVWAMAVICYKRAGERVPAFHLNLFKNTIGAGAFFITLLIVAPYWPEIPWREVGLLCISGVLGITVADTMVLRSLQLLGAGRMAVVDCLYTPSMIICAVLMLGDTLVAGQIIGALLVIAGVLVVGLKEEADSSSGEGRRNLRLGVLYGAGAMATMAFALVLIQPLLQTIPVLHLTWIRLAASVLGGLLFLGLTGRVRELAWVREPGLPWGFLIAGGLLGTFIGMGLWIAAFKYTDVTTAAILNQSSVFFILFFATWLLKEKLSKQKIVGALLGVSGVVLATLSKGG